MHTPRPKSGKKGKNLVAKKKAPCHFCDYDPCDCIERRDCKDAGKPHHTQCGKLTCGCPKFLGECGGACKKEGKK